MSRYFMASAFFIKDVFWNALERSPSILDYFDWKLLPLCALHIGYGTEQKCHERTETPVRINT